MFTWLCVLIFFNVKKDGFPLSEFRLSWFNDEFVLCSNLSRCFDSLCRRRLCSLFVLSFRPSVGVLVCVCCSFVVLDRVRLSSKAFFLLHIFDIAISKEISNPTTTMTGFRWGSCVFLLFVRHF